jgi:MFS transporter, DHA1 family, multidrug resistance protein
MQTTRPNEFIALVAMLTALVAMSIDTMLPAVGIMAKELGAQNPNDRQLIILAFFLGMMFGTLIFGPISDSVGRKKTIFAGMIFYIAGAIVCMFSTSFVILIVGRLIQGFGAASPRIVSMAMVRDGAKGADMARIMSFVMSVFMLVPIFAPSIGQLVLYVASWRYIFTGFVAAAIIAAIWLQTRQSETLAPANRLPFSASKLIASAGEVIQNPVSFGYTIAVGFIFAAFTTFLGTSQQIFAEQYSQGDAFALWFGGLATGIAMSMTLNGIYVRQIGMRRISQWALRGFLIDWSVMLLLCYIYKGHPPLPFVGIVFFISFFVSGMIFGNYNAMALEPMGHIAGMAAAISGAISSLIAVMLGGFAGRQYDGTLFPLTIAFVSFGVVAYFACEWAERGRARKAELAQKSHA